MENCIYTPENISIDKIRAYKTRKAAPIDGFTISNITVPDFLRNKKRPTESNDNLIINVRQLFNSLSEDNLPKIKEQLRNVIIEKTKTAEMIDEVSQEILLSFVVNEQNIKNYMHLLNSISGACVSIPQVNNGGSPGTKNISNSIGNSFLYKCKNMIFALISEKNIRELAYMDPYDDDELDEYNRKREKIINLIITICSLYEQRNTTHLKLTAHHLYPLMIAIIDIYLKLQKNMDELGNPYAGDCSDEEEYEILRRMCTIYAEQLYTFISREANEFRSDLTIIKTRTMNDLTEIFKQKIVPTISEEFLISKCKSIQY